VTCRSPTRHTGTVLSRGFSTVVALAVALLNIAGLSGQANAASSTCSFQCFTASPSSGPPGTVVHMTGAIPRGHIHYWAQVFNDPHVLRGLAGGDSPLCPVSVPAQQFHEHLDLRTGRMDVSFVVGRTGRCSPPAGSRITAAMRRFRGVPAGRYVFELGSLSTDVGLFTVTTSGGSSLPFSGGDLAAEMWLGSMIIAVGVGTSLLGRRRRTLHTG
jgi:hypothetical protein